MPPSHSGRLCRTCNAVPKGHVGSNPTGGSTFLNLSIMSKSRRLPIYKDHGIARRSIFKRRIKRRIRQRVKDIINLIDKETYELPSPKILVNDWDWCDYILDYRFLDPYPGENRCSKSKEEWYKSRERLRQILSRK